MRFLGQRVISQTLSLGEGEPCLCSEAGHLCNKVLITLPSLINERFANTIKSNCDSILLCLALQRYGESGVLTQGRAGDGDGSQARAQRERFLISIVNYSILATFLLRLLRKRCFLAMRTVRGPSGTGRKQCLRRLKCLAWKKSNTLSWARDKNRLGERSGEDRVLEGGPWR